MAIEAIIATIASIAGLSGKIGKSLITTVNDYQKSVSSYLIIGIVNGDKIPDMLAPYNDYTSLRKLRHGSGRIRILHCRTLSFALRKCDFVLSDGVSDCKIIGYSDEKRLAAIVTLT